MEEGDPQLSATVQSLAAAYKDKVTEEQALVEKLIQLIADGERTCEKLKYDLEDQTESRRHWQRRATDAESTLAKVQQVMVLVDGSRYFFRTDLIQAGPEGARQAAEKLLAEAKDLARAQHRNDLPENISVVVHIFSDIQQLADELYNSHELSDPAQLWAFVHEVSSLYPGITISNCDGRNESADAKLRYFYELYLENSHCRHLFLALAHDSAYYEVLQSYRDDEYTKSKTSLVRHAQGVPPGLHLPFHTAEFSTLESARRPSAFPGGNPFTLNGRTEPPPIHSEGCNNRPPVTDASSLKFSGHAPSMTILHNTDIQSPTASKANTARANGETQEPFITEVEKYENGYVEPNGDVAYAQEDASLAGVVKLDSSTHTSSQSNKAADQALETVPGNTYVPAPVQGDWGDEAEMRWADPAMDPEPDMPRTFPRRGVNGNKKNQWQSASKRQAYRSFNGASRSTRRVPKQYEGSWDDMAQHPVRAPTQASSPSPRLASSPIPTYAVTSSPDTDDFPAAFARRVIFVPDPDPLARPIRSPIGLNRMEQRVDLKLPRALPEDWERFALRTRSRGLCNEHHLRFNCHNTKCPFDHEPIDNGVYLALRYKARTKPCSIGPDCRRHDCFGAHHCTNMSPDSTCGRFNCPFEARSMHSVLDLEIVHTI